MAKAPRKQPLEAQSAAVRKRRRAKAAFVAAGAVPGSDSGEVTAKAGSLASNVGLAGVAAVAAAGSLAVDTVPAPVAAAGSVAGVAGLRGAAHGAATAELNLTLDDNAIAAEAMVASPAGFPRVPFAFPADWEADRLEALRLLNDLPEAIEKAERGLRLLEAVRTARARERGIGHNQPPQAIPPTEEIVAEAKAAGEALREELSSNEPHPSSIRLAIRGLKRAIGWIGKALAAVGGAAAVGVAKGYGEGIGKKLAEQDADAVIHHVHDLEAKLTSIVTPIVHLFSSMHLPL